MIRILFLQRGLGRLASVHRCRLRSGWPTILLLALARICGWPQSLAIRHVTVIDATGRAPQPNRTVVVQGDRIVSVRPPKKAHIPKGAVVVDGISRFLIPGLWDMHVHGASDGRASWRHLLFLANGVVGVREMSGPPDAHAWRATQVSNADPSPAIYLGSPIVDGPNPVWPDSLVAGDEARGREIVDQQQRSGADFIKVYSRLPRKFTSPSPTRRTGAAFRSRGMCRNR